MEDELIQKLNNYKVPQTVVDTVRSTKIIFLVGVSGAGKDTVRRALIDTGNYHYIVSHTTRAPRVNHGVMEKDGQNYHFIDQQRALNMLSNGEFVEAKIFSGNVYGTSVAELEKAQTEGKIAITEIEVQGVAEYQEITDGAIPIFLLPPDYETWITRLDGRYEGNIDQADLEKRLKTAKVELEEALEKPYFEYVVNRNLQKTIEVVNEIAHGRHSDKKNQEARDIAKALLQKLS